MKIKINFRIFIIIILIFVLIVMCYFYFKEDNVQIQDRIMFAEKDNIKIEDNILNTNTKTIQTTSEVISSLTEKIELHATYYLEECYVDTNQQLKSGDNILKYTNGTYLTAPYDCVIGEINLPNDGEKCTNNNYIEISSSSLLAVQFKVDETKINEISIGQEVKIEIKAYDNKILIGNITNISSTASNGNFTVTAEFENDGDVMIGMTADITIE